jgi:tRNA(Ile)-lysidine synthase
MEFGADLLRAVLEETLPAEATGLLVGVSGGADSACLLTALAQWAAEPRHRNGGHRNGGHRNEGLRAGGLRADGGLHAGRLRAVHVDHGLQAASAALRDASVALCGRLDVPLEVVEVHVETGGGVSIEAAARTARYRAFANLMAERECLLTAHHAQDQAETLLLQLLRGAGLKGLSAMPVCRSFAHGWHLRPLLGVAQRDLRRFGARHGVAAADDPMNLDPRFDRAYLRLSVWPSIEQRWPGAAAALARTARHLAEAQQSLDRSAADAVDRLRDGDALSVTGLRSLAAREQVNALRHWLGAAALVPPSAARLTEALRQVLTADADHLPAIVWGSHALRRYRDRLFVTPAVPPCLRERDEWRVDLGARLELGPGLGTLHWAAQPGGLDAARLPGVLSVCRRRGGERLKLGGRAGTRTVQHLCQSLGVLPWMRDALPMIYAGDALIAVGDLWQDGRWSAGPGRAGIGCVWENAPNLT